MGEQQEEDKQLQLKARHVICIFLLVAVAWVLTPIVVPLLSGSENGAPGQYGDMFGAVNALFSGFAFAGIIVALLYQKRELQLQRRELKATREELAGSKEQMKLQNENLSKQNFESTFFNMLKLHHEIVQTITYGKVDPGRTALGHYYRNYQAHRYDYKLKETASLDDIASASISYFGSNDSEIGHYLRNLLRIIRYIDEGQNSLKERRFYSSILMDQLSTDELLLLFYYGLRRLEADERGILERYSFFRNLSEATLAHKADVRFYDPNAFAGA